MLRDNESNTSDETMRWDFQLTPIIIHSFTLPARDGVKTIFLIVGMKGIRVCS